MKSIQIVSAALITSALLVALPGCEKEGPAERAGESIDEAVEKTGEQIEKAGDAIQDSAQGDNK
ncbi:MAG: hypothetical protein K8I04_09725 [Gammaproteobacteria bacterium]|nr:hypothetical protein [Gammaproteobacteria bacterium]